MRIIKAWNRWRDFCSIRDFSPKTLESRTGERKHTCKTLVAREREREQKERKERMETGHNQGNLIFSVSISFFLDLFPLSFFILFLSVLPLLLNFHSRLLSTWLKREYRYLETWKGMMMELHPKEVERKRQESNGEWIRNVLSFHSFILFFLAFLHFDCSLLPFSPSSFALNIPLHPLFSSFISFRTLDYNFFH